MNPGAAGPIGHGQQCCGVLPLCLFGGGFFFRTTVASCGSTGTAIHLPLGAHVAPVRRATVRPISPRSVRSLFAASPSGPVMLP